MGRALLEGTRARGHEGTLGPCLSLLGGSIQRSAGLKYTQALCLRALVPSCPRALQGTAATFPERAQ